jgi:hypothetical protein
LIGHSVLYYAHELAGLGLPQTQTTPAEREVLASFLPGGKRIAEIGVFEGFTTRILAERADADAVINGIAPLLAGWLGISWGERIALSYNSRHLASSKIRFDGDHSLPGISADWVYWSERVAPGGIIAGHDRLLTPEKLAGYTLGNIEHFRDHIRHDPRFEIVRQQASMSVLRKS